jgi:signal transduction histidine kinase
MTIFGHNLDKSPGGQVIGLSLFFVIIIGAIDYWTGFTIFFEAFYLLPIALAAWHQGRGWGFIISAISVAVWLAGDYAAGVKYSSAFVPVWNGAISLTVYFVVVMVLNSLRQLHRELEERVRQRTVALGAEMQERARLEKELVELGEQSQRQIGHELHDVLGQHLTATAFAGQVLTGLLEKKSLSETADARKLVALIDESIRLTRRFAHGLQPVELKPEGLMDGFHELARSTTERFNVACEFECRKPVLLNDADTSTQLYRIAQEAVMNAIKHGHAKMINISLENDDQATTLAVTDDGNGLPDNVPPGKGLGLRIMAYRAGMIGAKFQIERLPDTGTRVITTLPPAGKL